MMGDSEKQLKSGLGSKGEIQTTKSPPKPNTQLKRQHFTHHQVGNRWHGPRAHARAHTSYSELSCVSQVALRLGDGPSRQKHNSPVKTSPARTDYPSSQAGAPAVLPARTAPARGVPPSSAPLPWAH